MIRNAIYYECKVIQTNIIAQFTTKKNEFSN